jgi:hypothetical protein
MRPRFVVLLCVALAALTTVESAGVGARPRVPPLIGVGPLARLVSAPELLFNGDVDSNSPAVRDLVDGVPRLHLFTSTAGVARRSDGESIETLSRAADVTWIAAPQQGVWMEAVVPDEQGIWYGYYHNERAGVVCGDTGKVLPRIGAARSADRGLTWEDLGPILEAPLGSSSCETTNHYFHGGVGDVSVMLDHDREYLYLFYSQYFMELAAQGIVVARIAWASRDEPQGRVDVWNGGAWLPPSGTVEVEENGEPRAPGWVNATGTPLFPTTRSWHDPEGITDAFWGPAVHWNTYLSRYVMLLNRSQDVTFTPQGIYASYNASLDPATWSSPQLVLRGGRWYPQVMGLASDGTDKVAGQTARFFMSGQSNYMIEFLR